MCSVWLAGEQFGVWTTLISSTWSTITTILSLQLRWERESKHNLSYQIFCYLVFLLLNFYFHWIILKVFQIPNIDKRYILHRLMLNLSRAANLHLSREQSEHSESNQRAIREQSDRNQRVIREQSESNQRAIRVIQSEPKILCLVYKVISPVYFSFSSSAKMEEG